jgi:protein ImuA
MDDGSLLAVEGEICQNKIGTREAAMPRYSIPSAASLSGARRPRIALWDGEDAPGLTPTLALGRAHEATGPARRVFAALAAGRLAGPVLWVMSPRSQEGLHPQGLAPFFDPSRLVIARPRRAEDALWTAEEALRSGACPLVVAELDEAPGLTPMRRLNLSAESGAERMKGAPLMLALFARGAGSGAAETRWRVSPAPGWALEGVGLKSAGGPPRWRLKRIKDKTGRPAAWEVVQPSPNQWRAAPVRLAA